MKTILSTLAIFSLLLGNSLQALNGQSLDAESFAELHQGLTNREQEKWKSIPWQTDLLKAQNLAATEQKPIFIWAMDGHPLGCT